MKKSQLRQIIREEIEKLTIESELFDYDNDPDDYATRKQKLPSLPKETIDKVVRIAQKINKGKPMIDLSIVDWKEIEDLIYYIEDAYFTTPSSRRKFISMVKNIT
jgi:hypothetical protein